MSTIISCSREVRELDSVKTGKIYGINGPVIYLKGKYEFKMSEMVYVGKERLVCLLYTSCPSSRVSPLAVS